MWSWKWQPTSWMTPHFWENLLNFSSSHVITLLRRIVISLLLPAVDILQDFAVFLTCRYESFDNISKILSWLISPHSRYNLPFPLSVFLCSVFRTMSSALVKGPRYGAHSLKFGLRFNLHMIQPGNACNNFFFNFFPKQCYIFCISIYIFLIYITLSCSSTSAFSNSLIEHLNVIFLSISITNAHGVMSAELTKKIYSMAIQYVKCKVCIHYSVGLKFFVEHTIVCVDQWSNLTMVL